jgi:apolipoprotein D and lipocalin family protein
MHLRTLRSLVVTGVMIAATASTGVVLAAPAGAITPDHDRLPVTPVAALDLTRYAGTWLQLADVPATFTAQCERDTQAQYSVLPDGLVRVVNTCVRADGSLNTIEGRARVVGPDSNAQLQVTFVQFGGQWQFQLAGDYWVIGLDQRNYSWAVVGDPDRSNGFVLSRKPTLTPRQIGQVLRSVIRNGYDPCDFEITATTGGVESNRPLCG